jgi:hypothetical protein
MSEKGGLRLFVKGVFMTVDTKHDAAAETVQHVEDHLELPYISGDLRAWAESLEELLCRAADATRHLIENEHPQLFKSIVKNHSNLRGEVEKLEQEGSRLPAAFDDLIQQTQRFAGGIDETALAGQQFQPMRERLVNEGLSLVLRVRRHRAAIDTWLSEAMQRDNGVGD